MRRDHPEALPEEEEEGDDEFYESLDRILSSSGSSTSTSDDDADYRSYHGGGCGIGGGGGQHHRRRGSGAALYHLPAAARSYDVWISEPSSVEERRCLLLQRMGLIDDPALSRGRVALRIGEGGAPPSRGGAAARRPCDLFPAPATAPVAGFARSRSDGTVDPDHVNKEHFQRRAVSFGSGTGDLPEDGEGRGFRFSLVADDRDDNDRPCTIKNLDDGSEFVVKEIREDGMWNKLREVGTGRQLTMEEFEMCVGRSPIVQELMRRQNVEDSVGAGSRKDGSGSSKSSPGSLTSAKPKKKGSWLRSIRNMAGTVVAAGHHHKERRSSDEKDTSSEKGGRRSSSATDDSLDGSHLPHHGPERVKVRQYGKSYKELTGLYITQEIHAHNGSIWSIRFSLDGRYLASAGEDCIIHVWEVVEFERKGELSEVSLGENGNCYPFLAAINSGSPELPVTLGCVEGSQWEKKRRSKVANNRRSLSSDHLMVPEHLFALSEKPVCSFSGHKQDVFDLSWSKSQYLLSSSMDKTVRLWHMSSRSCLKTFTHSDYVTCIQFNPVDDRYFISGSLDEKLRLWSIPDRQVVDWNDIHEMVTAVCFTPDGKGALLGTHKGSCYLFDTSENKLHNRSQIDLQAKKRKSRYKKITGFQFAPGSSSEVLITSADSRIRVVSGIELVHKFKGFRNTSSQISASFSPNGKYVICASEDSHVYMWRYDADSQPGRTKGVVNTTQSYEHFHCQDVTVAVAWPGTIASASNMGHSRRQNSLDAKYKAELGAATDNNDKHESSYLPIYRCTGSPLHGSVLTNMNLFADGASTWPEDNFSMNGYSRQNSGESFNEAMHAQCRSAWGMAIVTAGRGGEIRTYQNFGFPFRL